MYNHVHVFDFSFVAPGRRPRTKPQLVFTIDRKNLSELTHRLQIFSSRWNIEKYLGKATEFSLPAPDLFGNTEFGYQRCGLVTQSGEEVSLRLELSREKLFCITATIHLLAMALRIPYEPEGTRSNRSQQIDIETVCEHRDMGYGHALGGYVSADVRNWLHRQGAHLDKKHWITDAPEPIARAMRQAWTAVAAKESHRWASECNAYIAVDGKFILECMGNACDVAIYPDSLGGVGESVSFGCHNLDQARQQVTLLAGLAKLCELARSET